MAELFCNSCLAMLKKIKSTPEGGSGQHHSSYGLFQEAVSDGCRICQRFRRLQLFEASGEILDFRLSLSYTYGYESPTSEDFVDQSGLPDGTVQLCLSVDRFEYRDIAHGWQGSADFLWAENFFLILVLI